MSAQANLTIYDGQATPAAHTFYSAGVLNGIATYLEKTSALIAGYFKYTLSMKFGAKPGDPSRHLAILAMPTVVTETVNGVDYQKLVRVSTVKVEAIIAPDATLQERKDLFAYMAYIMTNPNPGSLALQVRDYDPTT